MASDGLPLLTPDWPELPPHVGAVTTLRYGGGSRAPYDDGKGEGGFNLGLHVGDRPQKVEAHRQRLQAAIAAAPLWLSQVHGVEVVNAAWTAQHVPADASVASQAGVACAILTADCLPLLLADRQGKVVGAAHAGWRGLAGGVVHATVAAMRRLGADDITAWLGPAIGPDCFEVGSDVVAAFAQQDESTRSAFVPCSREEGGVAGKYLADIYQLARLALAREGILTVRGGERCTVTERDCFYSYRRDGVTGRMATLIWRR